MKKIIMFFVMLSFVVMMMACGESSSQVSESEGNNANDEVVEETSSNGDEENTEDSEEEEFGTRNNPVAHGVSVDVEVSDWLFGDAHYEMELIESISGAEALEMVKASNEFNDEPGDGKEYILAKFRLQLIEVEEEPFDVNPQQFDIVSASGASYEDFVSVAGLDPEFRSDLYEGGEIEGWVPFLVDANDEKPLAKYGDIWFDLRGE